jgi:hypothetical protein
MARGPEGNVNLTGPLTTVSFDPDAFDVALRSQGVKLTHMRAMKCPVGLVDRHDVRFAHEDHSACSNGHIYTRAGEVTCLFTGNGNKQEQQDYGLHDGGTVQITAPLLYDESDILVDVMPYDRFYLNEEAITVPHSQLVESSTTGHDRLDHPAVAIVDVIDNRGVRHNSGEYKIEEGQLVWTNGGLPYDLVADRGSIYAIRFTYRPYWYVKSLMHQVRVAQVETVLAREIKRFPQQWLMQREYIFEKENKDELAPDSESPRQVKGPRKIGLGPR